MNKMVRTVGYGFAMEIGFQDESVREKVLSAIKNIIKDNMDNMILLQIRKCLTLEKEISDIEKDLK